MPMRAIWVSCTVLRIGMYKTHTTGTHTHITATEKTCKKATHDHSIDVPGQPGSEKKKCCCWYCRPVDRRSPDSL